MGLKNSYTSPEAFAINKLQPGNCFYTEKADKDMTAIANYYGIKIKTERLIVLHHITLNANRITKVTLL